MTGHIEEAGIRPAEAGLQPTRQASVDVKDLVVHIPECSQIVDKEENEVDLMIQLSGMVYHCMETENDKR